MTPTDFNFISSFLKATTGLTLTPDKTYLLESRLQPIARKMGILTVSELIDKLRSSRDTALGKQIAEAMTTNETFFFRDGKPFDHLRDVALPQLMARRRSEKKLRIWCAAASTGQEPYSIAMILQDRAQELAGWRVEIIGTDISEAALDRARRGVYSQFEVQRGLPIQLLVKHFRKEAEYWVINQNLRSMVDYRAFNLLGDLSALGRFDIVFCRNVLIYFDPPTKSKILDGIARALPNDGVLYLGGAETVLGISQKLELQPNARGVYQTTVA